MLSTLQKSLLCLLAFFLPPAPVFMLQKTIFTKEFLVSVLLTLMAHFPGLLFSLYFIIIEYPRTGYVSADTENQRHHHHDGDDNQPSSHAAASYSDFSPVPAGGAEGSSNAPPPTYDEVVPVEHQLQHGEADSKRSGDNKVQV
ncbi:hypothetical protein CANTEDRAFT_128376 [Yamadazyma tenuis ATCC 10573]|uniref:Uncharacterized protein n=1 Tax=Candida tenuis (strain ATCC 10573 / BCRC 21748 / CBS 615 / JCM 9827 / NBRC 10315 / NRRL Y-1498 / VKM Y-70) TaxID=590646 RepID=G3BC30_CANTC|nr:uncharacterized protein CANTEDRAFT_128376 [Yamadazyma tenuis ATCC 10573]EGV60767.1 hypothetical protein CANTEDRAFT_128376 [Yamadazyma tenuis ATCC 10573]